MGSYLKGKIKIVLMSEDATIPTYATEGSAGFDLYASEDVEIKPGQTLLVKTGLKIAIPKGYEMQIRPRSGMSLKTSFRIVNSPGTIDSDYRGEICVIGSNIASSTLPNVSDIFFGNPDFKEHNSILIKKGDRIAQGVICPIVKAVFEQVVSLEDTNRGEKGFGSSDK